MTELNTIDDERYLMDVWRVVAGMSERQIAGVAQPSAFEAGMERLRDVTTEAMAVLFFPDVVFPILLAAGLDSWCGSFIANSYIEGEGVLRQRTRRQSGSWVRTGIRWRRYLRRKLISHGNQLVTHLYCCSSASGVHSLRTL